MAAITLRYMMKGATRSKITFTEEQRFAFQRLKDLLSPATEIHAPLYDRQFIVSCDASDYAVGACLSQMDNSGHERLLTFASDSLEYTGKTRWVVTRNN